MSERLLAWHLWKYCSSLVCPDLAQALYRAVLAG